LNVLDLPYYVTVLRRNGLTSAKISSLLLHKRLGSHTEYLLPRGGAVVTSLSPSFIENRGSSARFIDGASRELVHFLLVLV